jgi:hypothetical protein
VQTNLNARISFYRKGKVNIVRNTRFHHDYYKVIDIDEKKRYPIPSLFQENPEVIK